jgi:hypothetical protein
VQDVAYSLELRGHATPVSPGVLLTRAHGVHELFGGELEAVLEGRLSLLGGDTFELAATIGLGDGTAIRLRTVEPGSLGAPGEAGLREGTAICEVDRGSGRLAGATGRIVSSFLLSDTGELTETQAGILRVASPSPSPLLVDVA